MDLITLTDPRSPVSEAYRTLRTNLSFYGLDRPLRTLVVAAPDIHTDNSIALANLAVTLAQGGKRTLIVDCDLRKPSQHTLLGLEAQPGLTEALLDESAAPFLQQSAVENLQLLAAGATPPNPADVIGLKRLDELIERLLEDADIILFDAPPVVAVTDAVVLGAKVDGVLLVIEAGETRRDLAERAKQQLEQAHVRIIGAALTNAPNEGGIGKYG